LTVTGRAGRFLEMKTIEDRIAALEKSGRRWRWVALLLAVGMLGAIGWGAEKVKDELPPEITVRKISVVNAEGDPQVVIQARESVGLINVRAKGGGSIVLAVDKESGHFTLLDRNRRGLVEANIVDGKGSVGVYSPEGDTLGRLPTP
jgi:hypothetical protein